jgi:hypothetical protein
MFEVFSLAWNMVVHRSKESLTVEIWAHLISLAQVRERHVLHEIYA